MLKSNHWTDMDGMEGGGCCSTLVVSYANEQVGVARMQMN